MLNNYIIMDKKIDINIPFSKVEISEVNDLLKASLLTCSRTQFTIRRQVSKARLSHGTLKPSSLEMRKYSLW